MRSKTMFMNAATLIAAMTLIKISATAQTLPCSWPVETTGSGITNFAYPDTNATYWIMPLDSTRWKSVVIRLTSHNIPPSIELEFYDYSTSRGQLELDSRPDAPGVSAMVREPLNNILPNKLQQRLPGRLGAQQQLAKIAASGVP